MDTDKARRVAEAVGIDYTSEEEYVSLDTIDRIAALLAERDEAIALATAPMLARHQPCGCIVCRCASDERCNGCGSKRCGLSECVFADPHLRDAVYEDAPTYMQLRAELAEVREELSGLRGMMHDADSAFQQYLTCRDQYETALSAWNEEIELRKKVEAELAAAKAEVARLRKQQEARP